MAKTHIVAHDSEILTKGGKTLDRKLEEVNNNNNTTKVIDLTGTAFSDLSDCISNSEAQILNELFGTNFDSADDIDFNVIGNAVFKIKPFSFVLLWKDNDKGYTHSEGMIATFYASIGDDSEVDSCCITLYDSAFNDFPVVEL